MTAGKKLSDISVVENEKTEKSASILRGIYGNIIFVLMTLALVVVPSVSTVLKLIGIPALMLLLFRRDEFYMLLFPICLFESVWGQLFFGRVGILTVYLLLLIARVLLDKRVKINITAALIPVVFVTFYGLYAFFVDGNNEWLRLVVYVFLACCILSFITKNATLKQQMILVVLISALANGLTLALALNGGESIIEKGETISFRAWGLGLIDPNYSSFVCCLGAAAVMNLPKFKCSWLFAIASLAVFAVGIFRSGSRGGILCFVILLVLKFFMTGGVVKKFLYLLAVALIAVIIFYFVVPQMDFAEWTLERFADVFKALVGESDADITGGRTDLFEKYMEYIKAEDNFKFLFGFNILQSEELYGAVGVTHATHNTYLDYFLAFGLIGCIVLWTLYIARTVNLIGKRTEADRAIFMMKLTGLIFAMSLSFATRIIWWFLVFI